MSPAQCDKIRENKKALEAALPGPFGIPDQTLTGGLTLRSQTATVFLAFSDLEFLIRSHGNSVSFVAI